MNFMTIIAIGAALWLIFNRKQEPSNQGSSSQGSLIQEPLEQETALCMCNELSLYFEGLGDTKGQQITADLAKRIIAPGGN